MRTWIDDAMEKALKGFLRICSCGGMPAEESKTGEVLAEEAARHGYFSIALAEALQTRKERIAGADHVTPLPPDTMPDEGEFLAEDLRGNWIRVTRYDMVPGAVIVRSKGVWWKPRRWMPIPVEVGAKSEIPAGETSPEPSSEGNPVPGESAATATQRRRVERAKIIAFALHQHNPAPCFTRHVNAQNLWVDPLFFSEHERFLDAARALEQVQHAAP